MTTTWFTSDLHLGDPQVLDFGRDFPSVTEMNRTLCANWRSVVDDVKPLDEGQWLIHGHIHRAWLQRDRQICVAVDAWRFTPVNIETIALLMQNGPNRLDALSPAA